MRRPRSSSVRLVVFVCCSLIGVARPARSQSGAVTEGAPELLLPPGGGAGGRGQAAVALLNGAEALWWNPAMIARAKRELAFAFSQTLAPEGDHAASVLLRAQSGTFGVLARYIDYGSEPATPPEGGAGLGEFTTTSAILAASFAAPFGDRFGAGITYKFYQLLFDCTGSCPNLPNSTSTSALDLGGQYTFRKDSALTLAAAVRNVGLRLQVRDAPQADPLPSRLDVGVALAPKLAQLPPGARVRLAADVIARLTGGGVGYRAGGELSWQNRYQLRAGYVRHGLYDSNASIGVGYSTPRIQIDFAQVITDAAAGSASPAFFSLRWVF